MSVERHAPSVLSIAGSDSGGGAGIQADLKAFARCGVHGTCVVTAVTAQNTVGVDAIHTVPAKIIRAQARAVLSDIGVAAVKVGMLGTGETIEAVAALLDELPADAPVVVDPVMVAESGAPLLREEARQSLVEQIVPRANVITPNLPEARMLLGRSPGAREALEAGRDAEEDEARKLALDLLGLGPGAVLVTGGHRSHAVDLLVEAGAEPSIVEIHGERHPDGASHGSGCTHSAVLAAQLALGQTLLDSAQRARELAGLAIARGLVELGSGAGPVDVIGLDALREHPGAWD